MQQPRKADNKDHERDGAPDDEPEGIADMTPFHELLPALRKFVFAGSCCGGFVALAVIVSWDHGWIPGMESSFAQASDLRATESRYEALKSDVSELYMLSLAEAIRELVALNCASPSNPIQDQIDSLQLKYQARTGSRYPHTECQKQ